jgi:hypothetical protein
MISSWIISIAAGILGLFVVVLLWRRRRPAFIAGFLVVYSFTYRMLDIVYLDLWGPVYAIELERHVGGNGAAAMFVFAALCFFVPLALIASQKRILAGIESTVADNPYLDGLQRGALIVSAVLIGFLYLDMLRIGTIPLFVGMDRLEYNPISGLLHSRAYELQFLISAILGSFTVLPRLRGGRFSLSFTMLFLLLIMYWALTGNRFGAILVTGSYFALPFAAVLAMQQKGILRANETSNPWGAFVSLKVLGPIAVFVAAVTVTGLVVNSYYSVRNYADPVYHMTQRVLVQPVQTWATAWDRTNTERGMNPRAIDLVIFNPPPEAGGNPSMRYIMEYELGYFRANALLSIGQQYAGGYPEIFFEIFGFWLSIPLMLLLGCVAAFLIYLAVRSLCRGMVLTAVMAVYLSYGFSVAYLGGMLSFLLAPTYALKIAALIVFMVTERHLLARRTGGPADFPLNSGAAPALRISHG